MVRQSLTEKLFERYVWAPARKTGVSVHKVVTSPREYQDILRWKFGPYCPSISASDMQSGRMGSVSDTSNGAMALLMVQKAVPTGHIMVEDDAGTHVVCLNGGGINPDESCRNHACIVLDVHSS